MFVHLFALLLVLYGTANSGAITPPPLPELWKTDSVKEALPDGVSFLINKKASVLLNIPNIKTIALDYVSEGYFRIDYISQKEGAASIRIPRFVRGFSILKGKGSLFFDFRHTENWGEGSFPLLLIHGNGQLSFKNVEVSSYERGANLVKEKDRAFFWMPERYSHDSVNLITDIFWSYTKKISFGFVLGSAFLLLSLIIGVAGYFTRKNSLKIVFPALSIIFVMIFTSHFTWRFLPAVNMGIHLSTDEKIKRYYDLPEFGQLVAAARNIIAPSDKVLVMAGRQDWFSPQATCFNIVPTKCVYYWNGKKYYGIRDITKMQPDELDTIVYFNGDGEMPFELEKVWELNKNVFIGRRK